MNHVRTVLNLLSTAVFSATAVQAAGQPNVLLIMADDFGWRDAGCYGSTFYKTPNIDRLAADGMRFTDAYAANPLCSPTRSSILTGQYPIRTGFTEANGHVTGDLKHVEAFHVAADQKAAGPTSVNHLALEYYTLGKAMKAAGYATAFLGKWHLGAAPYIPENHGFDYVVGGRADPGPPDPGYYFPPWNNDTLKPNPAAGTHIDDYIGGKAVQYIKDHKDKPFFMCFWPYDVHTPFMCKRELVEKWKKLADPSNPQHCPTMAAMVEVLDNTVGQVLDALKANGLEENTIVIFTSDNGGNMYSVCDGTTPTSNWPLRSGKGNNYEGGVRVPLIIRWPGVTKPGSVCPDVVSSVDFYPTILQMTGQPLRPQDHKDGVSYVAALEGKPFDRGPVICDFSHFVAATMNLPSTSVRVGDWKLYCFWYDGPDREIRYELYNLKEDVGETNNLAAQYPEKVTMLSGIVEKYIHDTGVLKTNPNNNYNGRSIGVWNADENGKASAENGVFVLRADKPQFTAVTYVMSAIPGGAVLEFEARSTSGAPVCLQWDSTAQKGFGPERLASVPLSKDWTPARVDMPFTGIIQHMRFVLANAGQSVEIRNVRLLTPQGTVMMKYEFY